MKATAMAQRISDRNMSCAMSVLAFIIGGNITYFEEQRISFLYLFDICHLLFGF